MSIHEIRLNGSTGSEALDTIENAAVVHVIKFMSEVASSLVDAAKMVVDETGDDELLGQLEDSRNIILTKLMVNVMANLTSNLAIEDNDVYVAQCLASEYIEFVRRIHAYKAEQRRAQDETQE